MFNVTLLLYIHISAVKQFREHILELLSWLLSKADFTAEYFIARALSSQTTPYHDDYDDNDDEQILSVSTTIM